MIVNCIEVWLCFLMMYIFKIQYLKFLYFLLCLILVLCPCLCSVPLLPWSLCWLLIMQCAISFLIFLKFSSRDIEVKLLIKTLVKKRHHTHLSFTSISTLYVSCSIEVIATFDCSLIQFACCIRKHQPLNEWVFGKSNMLLFLKSMQNPGQPEKVFRHKGTKSGTSCTCKRVEVNKLECSTCKRAVIPAGKTF